MKKIHFAGISVHVHGETIPFETLEVMETHHGIAVAQKFEKDTLAVEERLKDENTDDENSNVPTQEEIVFGRFLTITQDSAAHSCSSLHRYDFYALHGAQDKQMRH